jgi:hypothetical protein
MQKTKKAAYREGHILKRPYILIISLRDNHYKKNLVYDCDPYYSHFLNNKNI